MQKLIIRQEKVEDWSEVEKLVEAAFRTLAISDQTEHLLVARLRQSSVFIPELSLVAELDGQIVGHILLTHLIIKTPKGAFETLSLAPVSVHPDFQQQGIGSQLIEEAHQKAKDMGFFSVLLVGHPEYYPRFGYQQAVLFGIHFPFEEPLEACMAVELKKGALKHAAGEVVYPKEFF